MNTFKITTHTLFAIVCALSIQSKSFAEPVSLSKLKTEIKTYHDSGAYEKELSQKIARATHYIIKRAEANKKSPKPKKLAIVLDIDETCLTNYNNMVARDFAEDLQKVRKYWSEANAPVIKPMLALYHTAIQKHVAVFFVTGRTNIYKEATHKNLKKAGYQQWAGLYFKPVNYKQSSMVPFKSHARALITDQGYTIITSIGDQKSDLTGGYAEKTYKLPNPYYFVP